MTIFARYLSFMTLFQLNVNMYNVLKSKISKKLAKEFGEAALRLKKAGFDGVQIHGAHGYLLSKFLSPVYNKRTDAYGGSPENNVRIILEIIESIKISCGQDFPVWIKLNASDFRREENAYGVDEFLFSAKEII